MSRVEFATVVRGAEVACVCAAGAGELVVSVGAAVEAPAFSGPGPEAGFLAR